LLIRAADGRIVSANVPPQKNFTATIRLIPAMFRRFSVGLILAALTAGAQDLAEMQQQFVLGNYAQVIKAAQTAVDQNNYRSDWRMLLVKSQLATGRYGEAYTNAMAGLNGYSGNIEMHLLARETALYQNNLAEATNQLEEISVAIRRLPATPPPPAGELVALGQALLLLGVEPRLILENCFQRAE